VPGDARFGERGLLHRGQRGGLGDPRVPRRSARGIRSGHPNTPASTRGWGRNPEGQVSDRV